jgi:hypothetical protein
MNSIGFRTYPQINGGRGKYKEKRHLDAVFAPETLFTDKFLIKALPRTSPGEVTSPGPLQI